MSDSTASTKSATASALSLLTPTETNALWSFLTQADKADVLAPEWAIFANRPELAARSREGKEELARATRSLMSIDDDSNNQQSQQHQRLHMFTQNFSAPNPPHSTYNRAQTNSSSNASVPAISQPLRTNSSSSGSVRYDASSLASSSHSPAAALPKPSPAAPAPANNSGVSSSRKRLSQDQRSAPTNKRPRKSSASADGRTVQPLIIPASALPSSSSSATAVETSRPPLSTSPTSTLIDGPYSALSGSIPESQYASQTVPPTPTHRRSNSSSTTDRPVKPPLLSTSQKKANHIQSEQKRRANIRRGYEALCEIVPALREAIRAEEEAERLALAELDGTPASSIQNDIAGGDGGSEAANANAAALARKKARGKAVAAAFGIDEGEKVDGRAGPRSEAVVLQKGWFYLCFLSTMDKTSLLISLFRDYSCSLISREPSNRAHRKS